MFSHRNLVRIILFLGAISASKYVRAHTESTFADGKQVYHLKYTTHITVTKKESDEEYLALARKHTNFLVGNFVYNPQELNSGAKGTSLRKNGDVKLDCTEENADRSITVQYTYDGEVVLDKKELTTYTLTLPKFIEDIATYRGATKRACSFHNYAEDNDILANYWMPSNEDCKIPTMTVEAKLEAAETKTTYPDYPRLAKDGVIQIAIFEGKLKEEADHDPYADGMKDPTRWEYQKIAKHLKANGFTLTESKAADGINSSSQETFEATVGKIKFVVKMFYGNSVDSSQTTGNDEFYARFLEVSKESAVVIYSGHSGFFAHPNGESFYEGFEPAWDADRYQIMIMNGCQTNDSIYPFYTKKTVKNLDLFINALETPINDLVTTSLIDALTSWAKDSKWTDYPTLVNQMDVKKAILGVVGEQDNPTEAYSP